MLAKPDSSSSTVVHFLYSGRNNFGIPPGFSFKITGVGMAAFHSFRLALAQLRYIMSTSRLFDIVKRKAWCLVCFDRTGRYGVIQDFKSHMLDMSIVTGSGERVLWITWWSWGSVTAGFFCNPEDIVLKNYII